MSRANNLTFLLFILVFRTTALHAQQNDFQAWPSIQVNLEVIDNLRLHLEEEVRFRENLTLTSRQINDLGISYRFNNALKVGIYYRLEANWQNADEFVWRNGIYSDISFRQDAGRFTFGYRLRVQSSKVERNDSDPGLFDKFRHRHKLSAEYDLKGIPLTPFIESELFVDYSRVNQTRLKGMRTWLGMDFKVKKLHTLSLKYGIDQEINTSDPLRSYIVAFGYTLDLKFRSGK
jgi:hypothetical protein